MILCDIGNSYYHFFKDGLSTKMPVASSPRIKDTYNINHHIYYISVNKQAEKNLVHENKCINLELFLSNKTKYDNENLGIDRKVACYKAKDVIIVDAGSAITVDIIHGDMHVGGFILAGLKSMMDNISSISEKLDTDMNLSVDLRKPPTNTVDAISFGILKPIELMIRNVSRNKNIIFTGGDGKFFSKFFDNSIYNERLIFNNMMKIIKDYDLDKGEI